MDSIQQSIINNKRRSSLKLSRSNSPNPAKSPRRSNAHQDSLVAAGVSNLVIDPVVRRSAGVHFDAPPNLKDMLMKYNDGDESVVDELEGFITHLRNQQGAALIEWLRLLTENCVLLRPERLEHFVIAVLNIPWVNQESAVVEGYRNFLVNLITAHNFYAKPILQLILCNFVGQRPRDENDENAARREDEAFRVMHETAAEIFSLMPLLNTKETLLAYARKLLPFKYQAHTVGHKTYIQNLLKMSDYLPKRADKFSILELIIERIVDLDVEVPKDNDWEEDSDDEGEDGDDEDNEMFKIDGDEMNPELRLAKAKKEKRRKEINSVIENLDDAMEVMFQYVDDKLTSGESATEDLYRDLYLLFESHLLPTYATGHVQYIVFYFLSKKPDFTPSFLDWLWRKFLNPNTPAILRQSTASYIASMVSRAKFVDINLAKMMLERIVHWIHSYIKAREEEGSSDRMTDYAHTDVRAHGPFYAACQAAVYMFTFRHKEFVASTENLAFVRTLNFSHMITSNLNPLRVCLPAVVNNFAAISRHYQLVYCDTILERNARINLPVVGRLDGCNIEGKPVLLDSFFPFDPYRLQKSLIHVEDSYRVYDAAVVSDADLDSDGDGDDEECIDDIDLEEDEKMDVLVDLGTTPSQSQGKTAALMNSFMYGTSPGFRSRNISTCSSVD